MALKIQSTMEPEGEFPVAKAEHIEMPDGKRLSEESFAPTVAVTEIEGGHRVTITDVNGTNTFDVMDGEDGSGGTAEPLSGSTAEITPSQISEALAEGRPLYISHTDSTYGTNYFSGFGKSDDYNFVVAATNFELFGSFFSAVLMGFLTDGSWTYSVEEITTKASFLSGTTAEITPSQVSAAVMAGDPVAISYTDSTYGQLVFSDFAVAASLNRIVGSFTTVLNGQHISAYLGGNISNGDWVFELNEIPGESGDSEEKTVTAVDLSGYESGTITETFSDGTSLTYTLTFDEDGNITKIVDSDGNETVLTW